MFADKKSFALSIRDYDETKKDVVIKHYRIRPMDNGGCYISPKRTFSSIVELVEHYKRTPPDYFLTVKIKSLLCRAIYSNHVFALLDNETKALTDFCLMIIFGSSYSWPRLRPRQVDTVSNFGTYIGTDEMELTHCHCDLVSTYILVSVPV